MKELNDKGAGYVLLYAVAVDNSTRTFFSPSIDEIYQKIEEFADIEYIGLISVFQTPKYFEIISPPPSN